MLTLNVARKVALEQPTEESRSWKHAPKAGAWQSTGSSSRIRTEIAVFLTLSQTRDPEQSGHPQTSRPTARQRPADRKNPRHAAQPDPGSDTKKAGPKLPTRLFMQFLVITRQQVTNRVFTPQVPSRASTKMETPESRHREHAASCKPTEPHGRPQTAVE